MAQNDVYEVTLTGRLLDQKIANVFFYNQVNVVVPIGGSISQLLASEFNTQMCPSIAAVMSNDVTLDGVRVRNLFNTADSFDLAISRVGTVGGSTMSAFNAIGYRLNPSEPVVKAGAKRFAGVPSPAAEDGVITSATFITALNTLSDKLEAPINGGIILPSAVWYPVIVKRVRSGVSPNYEYRLPENVGESVTSQIANALFSLIVTSQISRKIGRGN